MGQLVKLLLVMPASCIGVLAGVLDLPGKAVEGSPNAWGPVPHVGNLDGTVRPYLQPGPALVIVDIWEVYPRMED